MKKLILAVALLAAAPVYSNAQSLDNIVNTLNTVNKVNNAAKTAKELSSTLKSALGLSSKQQVNLASTFTKYIKNTNGIAKLANSDAATYAAKLAGINTNTLNSVKSILTAAQYAKLLGLTGGNASSSALSTAANLLGGNKSNTSSAASILNNINSLTGKGTNSTSTSGLSANSLGVLANLLAGAK